jgi:hypothetical protein
MPRSLDLIPPGSRGSDPYLVAERSRGPSPRPRVGSGARCIKVAFVCSENQSKWARAFAVRIAWLVGFTLDADNSIKPDLCRMQ